MRFRWLGVLGITMMTLGIVGMVWVLSARTPGPLSGTDASLGARIYLDGIGETGSRIPRRAAGPGMMGGGCVTCHGIDGAGGYFPMMGGFEAPDIRYTALTSPHGHDDEEAWSDTDIRRAVREGIEPDGERLSPFMPRWDLTDVEFDALLDYLKELDGR